LIVVEPHHPFEIVELAQGRKFRRVEMMEFVRHCLVDRFGFDPVLDDDEMIRAALPALRADFLAVETYAGAEDRTVGCPVTVLTGDDDPKTTLDEAMAWERHTSGPFEFRVFSGGHFFLVERSGEIIAILRDHFAALV